MTSNHAHKTAVRNLMAAEHLTYTAALEELERRKAQSNLTFIEAALSGNALLDDIDDWVERWHSGDQKKTLDQYLGFTESEGAMWASNPASLRLIIAAHHQNTTVETLLAGIGSNSFSQVLPANEVRVQPKRTTVSAPTGQSVPNLFPLGTDGQAQVTWDVEKHPHVLITGQVGCGKTSMVMNMIDHVKSHPDDWEAILVSKDSVPSSEGNVKMAYPEDGLLEMLTILSGTKTSKKKLLVIDGFAGFDGVRHLGGFWTNSSLDERRLQADLIGTDLMNRIISRADQLGVHIVITSLKSKDAYALSTKDFISVYFTPPYLESVWSAFSDNEQALNEVSRLKPGSAYLVTPGSERTIQVYAPRIAGQ